MFNLHAFLCIDVNFNYLFLSIFAGDAVNTKSKRQTEKPPPKMPAVKAAITPPDPAKDATFLEEIKGLSHEVEPAKDCRKGLKGKSTVGRLSAKGGASSAAPRITIKLVAKKKVKTVKEPHTKSSRNLKKKGIQDQPKAKDIQGDQISSARVKLKSEPLEDVHGTEDKGGGTLPARRRGRSASKTEPVCQPTAKAVVDDQKKSEDQFKAANDRGTVEPKTIAKTLKHKDILTKQSPDVNQPLTRRRRKGTTPLSKKDSDIAAKPESLKNDNILTESADEISKKVIEAKPLVKSERRRLSKRLNKDVTVPGTQGPPSTEMGGFSVQSSDGLILKNEEMRVPSLKLLKIRNPKYDAQVSGKSSTRKKKRRKFIWTLTLVKQSPTQVAKNPVKVTEKTVSKVDQLAVCDTTASRGSKGMDKKSKLDTSAPQESESKEDKEKDAQKKAVVSPEEKSSLQVEQEVEQTSEIPLQEITDCGKVPPLQIKKVSSPGKHKSSKPSFLIQQVSPVPEKKEDVPKDVSEVSEEKPSCLNTEVSPTRRLRRRTPSLDSPQPKSVIPKPGTTQKKRQRKSQVDEVTAPMHIEDSTQASAEDSSSHGLPTNATLLSVEDSTQVTTLHSSEAPAQDSPEIADVASKVPVEVPPQKVENEVEPQIKEAKPSPVPSKPKRCRNNKVVKKKSLQKKKAVVSPVTAVVTELATIETTFTKPMLKEAVLPLVVEEEGQSETQECTQSEAKQDIVSVEEEQIQPPVKEETDIQLIDSQQSVVLESPVSDPKTLCLQRKSQKKVKKRRKSLIGQRQKHKHRSRDGKFAPLKTSENSSNIAEVDSDISTQLADDSLTPGSKLIGVQKRCKKKQTGLHFIGSKRPKPQAKLISELLEIGLDSDSLKQEESDTLVDAGRPDVVDTQPGKSKFIKNIKHFIMPVVSARSSRVIKTPQRFMDDAGMSVLPRRHSPKKGLQLGFPMRSGKKRDDGSSRPISPILPVDEEDILSEAQLDVDLFSAQDLEDDIDLPDSLFLDRKSSVVEKKKAVMKNSGFKWHLPEESSEDMFTLDKTLESKCEDLFLSPPVNKPTVLPTDSLDTQKKKSTTKFNKQMAHLKIFQKLNKTHTSLPKTKTTSETDCVSKAPQPPVDLAEGLDDEAMSISLRQRNTNTEKSKSKLKIEDLDSPGVVRKVSVCVRTMKSKSLTTLHDKEENVSRKDGAQFPSGKKKDT